MSNQADYVSQLMEFTGLDRSSAENLLEMNNFNLEQAINYHLENTTAEYDIKPGCSNSGSSATAPPATDAATSTPASSETILNSIPSVTVAASSPNSFNDLNPDDDDDNDVRAPIPVKREQLIMPEDDNFRYRKRRAPAFSVCPLRNFAREAELQEQQLNTYLEGGEAAVAAAKAELIAGTKFSIPVQYSIVKRTVLQKAKRARLEDLFRPPVDLLFWGTFRAARDYATSKNRWLIVNLQDNAEFKSQIINRDIWSDEGLKDLIHKYFILWQVLVDNPEGLRFKTFYKVEKMPYICIIDPRTGEEKMACDVVTSKTFTLDLNDYLLKNSYTLEVRENSSLLSRAPPTCTITKPPTTNHDTTKSNGHSRTVTENLPIIGATAELSEEDQLAIAIKNSLTQTHDDESQDDIIVLSDSEEEIDSFENYLGDKNDPLTTIQLRLPDGERAQFEWPSTTKIRAIKLYVQNKYPDDTKEPYKIINAFPRQNILELDEETTLADAKLHPRAILHLHPDN